MRFAARQHTDDQRLLLRAVNRCLTLPTPALALTGELDPCEVVQNVTNPIRPNIIEWWPDNFAGL